jgi:DNA mismatch endonuclease, patch repair protein
MSKIRGHDTFPERALRAALAHRRVAFRANQKIRRIRVDVAITGPKLVIMVHGCFWHGCRYHYVAPKSHKEFWRRKLTENRNRDRRQAATLRAAGWGVVVLWEHSLRADPDAAVQRLITELHVPTPTNRRSVGVRMKGSERGGRRPSFLGVADPLHRTPQKTSKMSGAAGP